MTHAPILQPVVVLLGWTLVMMVWMMATRLPAMRKSGIDLGKLRGTKASDADLALPPAIQWKAHNYNHLMEQPTLFYAVALVLAMIGQGDGFNLILAWAYVALRIAHSIVQAVWNKVSVRFLFFALSSVALVGLVLHAMMAVFR
jgi:hypothetical protein